MHFIDSNIIFFHSQITHDYMVELDVDLQMAKYLMSEFLFMIRRRVQTSCDIRAKVKEVGLLLRYCNILAVITT